MDMTLAFAGRYRQESYIVDAERGRSCRTQRPLQRSRAGLDPSGLEVVW